MIFASIPLAAQTPPQGDPWTGSIAIGVAGQHVSGSVASFRTENDLRSGLVIDHLQLRRGDTELVASGIGNAEPWLHAALRLRPAEHWTASITYDRRRSFLGLSGSEFPFTTGQWHVDRWRAQSGFDGWSFANLSLALRHTSRDGSSNFPWYGLNEQYLLHRRLNDTMNEAAFTIVTRTLPVQLALEQTWTEYRQHDDRSPASPTAIGGDPDLFTAANGSRTDVERFPTSRLTATWGSDRAEIAGSFLYSPARSRGSGITSSQFDLLSAGSTGRVQFVDDVIASASRNASAGNLRAAWLLAPGWTIRVLADGRDTDTDASLVGTRLLRMINPNGSSLDLTSALDTSTTYRVKDESARAELGWARGRWSAWGGAFTAQRSVDWNVDPERIDVNRHATGEVAGAAYAGPNGRVSAEYEHGSFEHYIFRTDPAKTDRLTVRFRSVVGRGFEVHGEGRFDWAKNPVSESGLDHSSRAESAGAGWTSADGHQTFGVDLGWTKLRTVTQLTLPAVAPDNPSIYDLRLMTTTAYGRSSYGRFRFSGSASRVRDNGETWPLTSWNLRGRLAFVVSERAELGIFGEKWKYDERRSSLDDYDATRYGVTVQWRIR